MLWYHGALFCSTRKRGEEAAGAHIRFTPVLRRRAVQDAVGQAGKLREGVRLIEIAVQHPERHHARSSGRRAHQHRDFKRFCELRQRPRGDIAAADNEQAFHTALDSNRLFMQSF